jgi:hypothetical protein
MTAGARGETAAVCAWQSINGQPTFAELKAHIHSCTDCADANIIQVWYIINGWTRGINSAHVHGARR